MSGYARWCKQSKRYSIMGFAESIKTGLAKFFVASGRSSRSEFWWYYLFILILTSFFGVVGGFVSGHGGVEQTWVGIIFDVIGLVFGISMICAEIRRLHDSGKSGWNVWWTLIPIAGFIYVLYLLCKPSEQGPNRYGPQPE